MRNVLKSSSLINSEEPVEIPDTVIFRRTAEHSNATLKSVDFNLKSYKKKDVDTLDEYFNTRKNEMLEEVNSEAQQLEEQAGNILAKARKQADEILAEAKEKADRISEDARLEAQRLFDESRKKGYSDGKSECVDTINDCFRELHADVNEIKQAQNEDYEKLSGQLRYFALEIAGKLVSKKISEDDTYLYELTVNALRDFKDADWITVTVSEHMKGLVQKLRAEQENGLAARNAEFRTDDRPNGTVVLESKSKVVDASIAAQLENIKHYFETYGDEEDGQRQG